MLPKLRQFKHMAIKKTDASYIIRGFTILVKQGECTIIYTAPFDRCDREADYATAWAAFEQRGLV